MKLIKLENQMKCNVCGKYFDMSDLSSVFEHEHIGISLPKGKFKGVKY